MPETTTTAPSVETVGDPDVRWLIVKCPSVDTLKRYLYDNAKLISSARIAEEDNSDNGYRLTYVHLVLVTGRVGRGDADNWAQPQADRLRSGLHSTTVHETYAQAWNRCNEIMEDPRITVC